MYKNLPAPAFRACQIKWTAAHDAALADALKEHPIIEAWLEMWQAQAAHAVVMLPLSEATPAQQIQVIAHDKGRVSMTLDLLTHLSRLTLRGGEQVGEQSSTANGA